MPEDEPRDTGGNTYTQQPASSCGSNGQIVYKWNGNGWEKDPANAQCGSGNASPPPVPNSSQLATINQYDEYRVIVCCSTG